jgi:transketolase
MFGNKAEFAEYEALAKELRREILNMIYRTKSPHIGGSFSMVELLVALYFGVLNINPKNPSDPERDKFILSKGHCCQALYAVLAKKGFLNKQDIAGFAVDGGVLGQHPDRNVQKGIEATTGSLGHGLSLAAGIALADKIDKRKSKTFVFLGDGEMDEGSNWEAILFAAHHNLDNLVAVVDSNKMQILGRTKDVLNLEPFAEKWRSFNWGVKEIDGHSFKEIIPALKSIPFENGKPSVIIANTVKGKGVSFMENELRWHDKYPDEEEYNKALEELI